MNYYDLISLILTQLHERINSDEFLKAHWGQTPMWSNLRQLRGILTNILQCKLQNKSVYDRKQLLFCWKSEDS